MPDHSTTTYPVRKPDDLRRPPAELGKCHIYYVHYDGTIFCEPNVQFNPAIKSQPQVDSDKSKDQLPLNKTIIALDHPAFRESFELSGSYSNRSAVPMPEYFKEKLRNICLYCEFKGYIAWQSLHQDGPHLDASFYFYDYLQEQQQSSMETASSGMFHEFLTWAVYTLRAPFLARQPVTLSLVHHIRVEGGIFVPSKPGAGNNQEHIFAFMAGFNSQEVGRVLLESLPQWLDIHADHFQRTAKLTPRLLISSVIYQSGRVLVGCDARLRAALRRLIAIQPGSTVEVTNKIARMNELLTDMNTRFMGTLSTIYSLAKSADTLINRISPFKMNIRARLVRRDQNGSAQSLTHRLHELDFCVEAIRDRDTLELVSRTMQYMIAGNTDFILQIIAVLTAFFLPATLVAIFLTGPMFDFTNPTSVIRSYPIKIYWSIAGSIRLLLVICHLIFDNPAWIVNIIDLIGLDFFKSSKIYSVSLARDLEKKKLVRETKSIMLSVRDMLGKGWNSLA
ncbi:hypothetical protein V8E51_008300 [Hyaloscypha variabilis]